MRELRSILCLYGLALLPVVVLAPVMYHVSYRRHLAEANAMLAPLYAELERGRVRTEIDLSEAKKIPWSEVPEPPGGWVSLFGPVEAPKPPSVIIGKPVDLTGWKVGPAPAPVYGFLTDQQLIGLARQRKLVWSRTGRPITAPEVQKWLHTLDRRVPPHPRFQSKSADPLDGVIY